MMRYYYLLLACCPLSVVAFSSPATTAVLQDVFVYPRGHATSTTAICAYGKGSEIYPACNEEPILLSASFPGGKIPPPVVDLLESDSSNVSTNPDSSITVSYDVNNEQIRTTGRKRRAVRKTLSHILKSAAKASSRRASETATNIDRTPAVLAALLIGTKCVSLQSIALVLGISAYLIGLASWCAAPKSSGTISVTNISDVHSASDTHSYDHVNMPSLPEKGHVPNLVANPLGLSLTSSRIYRLRLRLGATLGLLLPTLALGLTIVGSKYQPMGVGALIENAEHVRTSLGDPLFLLCFQAITEAVSRAALLPLPMRILVPVVYNTVRLSSLHAWAFPAAGATIPTLLRILGVGNLLYWYANLLLFLIPVGVVRYLRAHFFCVEAVEVTVRKGGDASVGLLP